MSLIVPQHYVKPQFVWLWPRIIPFHAQIKNNFLEKTREYHLSHLGQGVRPIEADSAYADETTM